MSRTDSNIEDDAAGEARLRLAAASKARTSAEAAELTKANAEMQLRMDDAGPRTDFNIEDEAAGENRLRLAAASKARKEAEAATLARQNAEQRDRNRTTAAATDSNIEDEAAGARRLELAAASEARKEDEARRLAQKNEELRQRLRNGRPRIDTDITDEEAGAARREAAAAAQQRRAAQQRMLRQRNNEMQKRLRNMRSRTDNRIEREATARAMAARQAIAATASPGDANAAGARTSATGGASRFAPPPSAAAVEYSDDDDDLAEVRRLRELLSSGTPRSRGGATGTAVAALPNSTHAPMDESNAAQRYFAASEVKANARGGFSRDPSVPAWDNKPYKPVPYELRGMRPVVTHEPWTPAAKATWARRERAASELGEPQRIETYATNTFSRLNDGMYESVAQLYQRKQAEERAALAMRKHTTKPWDATVWRYVPPALRGLKPITPEPWAKDEALFDREETPRGNGESAAFL